MILLNGPPGIGKSTAARRWAEGSPADAVVVEIDELRTSLPGWAEDEGTRLTARRMALEVVGGHLRRGADVIVPQYLGRPAFIDELEETARAAGAGLVQVQLVADEATVVARFEARRAAATEVAHPEHEVDDVPAAIADAVTRLALVSAARPDTLIVPADDDPEATVARLVEALER